MALETPNLVRGVRRRLTSTILDGTVAAAYKELVGLLTDEMRRLVDAELGFVATVCPDGTPNLSPKGTIAVWDADHLVFADVSSPGTVANLRHRPSIEVNVVDPLVRRGWRFKGLAVVHTDGAEYLRGVEFYERRGTANARNRIRSIVIVSVQHVDAIVSPAYDLGATSRELVEQHLARLSRHAELLLDSEPPTETTAQ